MSNGFFNTPRKSPRTNQMTISFDANGVPYEQIGGTGYKNKCYKQVDKYYCEGLKSNSKFEIYINEAVIEDTYIRIPLNKVGGKHGYSWDVPLDIYKKILKWGE